MSNWHKEPVPERQWAVEDRIPLRQVYLLSGNGGEGKSLVELMRAVAHVLGKDWLGIPVRQGPAIYLSAEDDEDELHIRLDAILRHYGATYQEVVAAGLHLLDYAGEECILGAPDKESVIWPTALFKKLEAAAVRIGPVVVMIDTAADTYAGNEIDRQQTTQFIKMGQRLAQNVNCSVSILAHPSVAGMATGTRLSGSTAWHNKVRARAYLTIVPADKGGDGDLRELKFMKNNYGRQSDAIQIRWQQGVFVLENAADNDRRVDLRFLDLMARYEQQGRGDLSDSPKSTKFAPRVFAKEGEGEEKFSLKLYEAAMARLFTAGEIHVARSGSPSRRTTYIARGRRP
jgi:RecA-family ATPase